MTKTRSESACALVKRAGALGATAAVMLAVGCGSSDTVDDRGATAINREAPEVGLGDGVGAGIATDTPDESELMMMGAMESLARLSAADAAAAGPGSGGTDAADSVVGGSEVVEDGDVRDAGVAVARRRSDEVSGGDGAGAEPAQPTTGSGASAPSLGLDRLGGGAEETGGGLASGAGDEAGEDSSGAEDGADEGAGNEDADGDGADGVEAGSEAASEGGSETESGAGVGRSGADGEAGAGVVSGDGVAGPTIGGGADAGGPAVGGIDAAAQDGSGESGEPAFVEGDENLANMLISDKSAPPETGWDEFDVALERVWRLTADARVQEVDRVTTAMVRSGLHVAATQRAEDFPNRTAVLSRAERGALDQAEALIEQLRLNPAMRDLEIVVEARESVGGLLSGTVIEIAKADLATVVNGFGNYTALESRRFLAGREIPFIVYCEMDDFVVEQTETEAADGRVTAEYNVETSLEVQVLDRDALFVFGDPERMWSRTLKAPIRDHWQIAVINLPATLGTGRYTVRVIARDKKNRSQDAVDIEIELVAG